MNWRVGLLGMVIALCSQSAFAKHRLTDPYRIARECKTEVEQFCKAVRPGRQRVTDCLRGRQFELSQACAAALNATQ